MIPYTTREQAKCYRLLTKKYVFTIQVTHKKLREQNKEALCFNFFIIIINLIY
jgi:hypothetical protein